MNNMAIIRSICNKKIWRSISIFVYCYATFRKVLLGFFSIQ